MIFSQLIEVFRQVVTSLRANFLRSILSALGVVIGISIVILMGYILTGLDLAMEKTFNIIGTDMLYVDKWDWAGGKSWKLIRQRKPITMEQAEELTERLEHAELAMPVARNWGLSIKYDGELYSGLIAMGTWSQYAKTPAGEILEGRFFTEFEEETGQNVIVLGHKVYEKIFPNKDAIGKEVKIDGHKFKVIGVVEKRGVLFVDFVDIQCFMPMKTFLKVFGEFNRSISVAVKAGSEQNMNPVRWEVLGNMRQIRNIKPWEEEDFSINESKSFEKSVEKFRLYTWGIGIGMTSLSFIVGIIGIMNIMFVSVTERTREIGIRKAVGANKFSILMQFIFESMILCFAGALVSFAFTSVIILIASFAIPFAVPSIDFMPRLIPADLFIIATIVSFFVGIAAGFIPALRAANLDPVDALRYE